MTSCKITPFCVYIVKKFGCSNHRYDTVFKVFNFENKVRLLGCLETDRIYKLFQPEQSLWGEKKADEEKEIIKSAF